MQRRAPKPLSIIGGAVLFTFAGCTPTTSDDAGAPDDSGDASGLDAGPDSDGGGSVDAGSVDAGPPATGAPCSPDYIAAECQGDGRAGLVCMNGHWQPGEVDGFCDYDFDSFDPDGGAWPDGYCCHCGEPLEPGGPPTAACSVPGFVGLDRAGRARVAVRHLR